MCALLDNATVSHDHNVVGGFHGGKLVRNNQSGLVGRDSIQGVLHNPLCTGIEG